MKKTIVADDHPLFRTAISQLLNNLDSDIEMLQADSMQSLQTTLAEHPDATLVLLDLHMPGAHGFSALAYLKGHHEGIPVLVVSGDERPEVVRRAMEFGARGFLPKSSSPEQIATAIETVNNGQQWLPAEIGQGLAPDEDETRIMEAIATLTPQQYLVLTMLAEGLFNKQIAYELDVTEATIKAHMTAIFRKLGVRSRTQVALAVGKLNLDPPEA
ncbi:response regulator transcription factor [Porticoccus sp. W117]|uniref:response regulator n=1 Tax=Porticoccus sp. W117 TaxID=3054777 RepID=UPI002596658F|nr:response regulator transcription factor [Porticoccus sp. W117]MDM3869922.1 response regulator transcription factor [Porticoccus sp. W117]